MIPRYLRLMKICTTDALCQYNKTNKRCDKMEYDILNNAQYEIAESYKKHKKIGDPVEVLNNILENLLKKCQKLRLLCRTMETNKILEKYKSNNSAFKTLMKVHEEMVLEVEECNLIKNVLFN